MSDFEEQLNELKILTKTSKIKDLADSLGVSTSTIRTWRSRNKIPGDIYLKAQKDSKPHDETEYNTQMTKIKIPPFDYHGGKAITEKLVKIIGSTNLIDLAESLGIPRTTISTWHTRNMTPFEIAVRINLAKGVSLRWLLLDEGDTFESDGVILKEKLIIEKIANSILDESGEMSLDIVTMERYGLTPATTRVIDLDGSLLFVNTEEITPSSGRYLLDIDGSISINGLQRLPGKKLAMSYGNTSVEVAEADIVVLGRVTLVMEKE
ncbi:Repressor protein [Moritella sp. JT01]|uniref:helix-turn-helix domain-containing protein n=1 Tax=Moritella sp. JT01 TaxID=756698 RepID=UPI000798458D|nr:helix-turn-helix domain-containing protein [Moritella sp. JT01]KXO13304.1 Repressor protein [Moritella sp. JT01]